MQRIKLLADRINWGAVAHASLNFALPISVLILVSLNLAPLAAAVVLMSKWRVFAVQPRHWIPNLRANMPDLIVGLSFLALMVRSADVIEVNILWTGLYIVWLLLLKPQTAPPFVGLQALAVQFFGLMALFWYADQIPEVLIVITAWFIAQMSARHFLSHFEEPLLRVISFGWGLVTAELAWLFARWSVTYQLFEGDIVIPQAALVVTTVGYVAGSLYYINKSGKLRKPFLRSYLITGCVILLLIILTSDWSAVK